MTACSGRWTTSSTRCLGRICWEPRSLPLKRRTPGNVGSAFSIPGRRSSWRSPRSPPPGRRSKPVSGLTHSPMPSPLRRFSAAMPTGPLPRPPVSRWSTPRCGSPGWRPPPHSRNCVPASSGIGFRRHWIAHRRNGWAGLRWMPTATRLRCPTARRWIYRSTSSRPRCRPMRCPPRPKRAFRWPMRPATTPPGTSCSRCCSRLSSSSPVWQPSSPRPRSKWR